MRVLQPTAASGRPASAAVPQTAATVRWSDAALATAIGLLSAVCYSALLTQQYSGDGIRWYPSITRRSPAAGDANHLLYPVLQWAWFHLLQAFGLVALDDPLAVVARLQILNALLAGVGIALFWLLIRQATQNKTSAALATLLLATCFAFSSHATDMTEVMPSFPPTVAALLLAVRSWDSDRPWRAGLAAGLLVALATALFESAVLGAPAVAVAFACRGALHDDGQGGYRALLKRTATQPAVWLFAATSAVSCAALYALSIGILVTTNPRQILRYAVAVPGSDLGLWGKFSLLHYLGLIFGWANAQFGLLAFSGGTRLLHLPRRLLLFDMGAIALTAGFGALTLAVLVTQLRDRRLACVAACFGGWLIVPAAFAGFWVNTYTKLWIQPFAAWAGLMAVAAAIMQERRKGRSAGPGWYPALAAIIVFGVAFINVPVHLLPSHRQADPSSAEASYLSKLVRPNDLLIADGWDLMGTEFSAFSNRPYITYTGTALELREPELSQYLQQRIRQTQEGGGTVYVAALVDESPADWQIGFSYRFHIEYSALAWLRSAVRPLPAAMTPPPSDAPEVIRVVAPL